MRSMLNSKKWCCLVVSAHGAADGMNDGASAVHEGFKFWECEGLVAVAAGGLGVWVDFEDDAVESGGGGGCGSAGQEFGEADGVGGVGDDG